MNLNIYEILVSELKEQNKTITFAESCTGGLMASNIVSVPGASSVFSSGFITYSAESKINILEVLPQTIEKYGIVSKEVAKEMALGALKKGQSSVAISVTGCAGPGEDSDGNIPGTICFAFAIEQKLLITEKIVIQGKDRNEIRENAVKYAFEKLITLLQ